MATKYAPEIESMLKKIEKKRGFNRDQAIAYMMAVACGRLKALYRYDESLPQGKDSKGVRVAGKRKMAERSATIAKLVPKVEEKVS